MIKKFTKHTPEQIVVKLEHTIKIEEAGTTNAKVAGQLQVSKGTRPYWSHTYGQRDRLQARELKALRDENAKLKKLLGKAELRKADAQGVGLRKTSKPHQGL